MLKQIRKFTVIFGAVGLGLIIGCGQTGPISSQDDAADQASAMRAAKPGGQNHATTTATDAGLDGSATSSTLYVQDGAGNFRSDKADNIKVGMPNYGDANTVRLKRAIFEVTEGTLFAGTKEKITMTCYSGTTLEDVNVVFDPSGLTFDLPAHLTLYLDGPVAAEDVMQVQHIYGSGANVEAIYTEISDQGSSLVVKFNLPGFSRYSLGGDQ